MSPEEFCSRDERCRCQNRSEERRRGSKECCKVEGRCVVSWELRVISGKLGVISETTCSTTSGVRRSK